VLNGRIGAASEAAFDVSAKFVERTVWILERSARYDRERGAAVPTRPSPKQDARRAKVAEVLTSSENIL
jgi:hypothetical protein